MATRAQFQSSWSSRGGRLARGVAGVLCAAAALGAGCSSYDRNAYTLTPDSISQYITVSAPSTMPADGMTQVTITAEVKERSPAALSVTFTVTAGTIIGGTNNGHEKSVPVDDTGHASIQFKSDTDPQNVDLVVTANKVTITKQIRLEAVNSSSLFSISVTPQEIPADGFTRTLIQVKLTTIGTVDQRAVTIQANDGTLFGSKGPGSPASETAGTDGIAQVELQSGQTPRTVTITVTNQQHTSTATVSFRAVATTDVIQGFTVDPTTVDADNRSFARVTVKVTPRLPADKRSISFKTNIGTFDNMDSAADAATNEAHAHLHSSEAGTAFVVVAIGGVTQQGAVQFATALPDRIEVTPDAATVARGGTMHVTAFLIRNPGRGNVTQGQIAQFAAIPESGPPGVFTAIQRSNTDGTVSATLSVPANAVVGSLLIKVTIPGSAAVGTAIVQVQ